MSKGLVLGAGHTLYHDLEAVGEWDGLRIAVNDAGWGVKERIDHWVTLHPEKLPAWIDRRKRYGGNLDFITWSRREPETVDFIVKPWGAMSSGGFAAQIALEQLECTEVILCGVPMTEEPHFWSVGKPWRQCDLHKKAWLENQWRMEGKVRSMSGWTRELLGAPKGIEVVA